MKAGQKCPEYSEDFLLKKKRLEEEAAEQSK
jgi:hypothetical protein